MFNDLVSENIPMGVILTQDGRILYLNDWGCRFIGYSMDDLKNSPFINLIHPDDQDLLIQRYQNIMAGREQSADSCYRIFSKQGETFWIRFRSKVVQHEGKPALMSFMMDETSGKRQEESLKRSEERYRELVDNLAEMIVVIKGGEICFVNKRLKEEVGMDLQGLGGMSFLEFIHPEDRDMVLDRYLRRIKGEQVPACYDVRLIKPDGQELTCEIRVSLISWEGEPATQTAILDISARRQAEKEKLALEKRLARIEKMESLGLLAGGIAHDFNNILFPIIAISEMLMEDLSPESQEYGNALEIYNAGLRGGDLVKQILSFSRQQDDEKIPVQVQSVLHEVLKLIRSTLPSDIEVIQDIEDNCCAILANPGRIHQVAMNLLTNAYHAVEPSSGTIQVSLRESALNGNQSLRYAVLTITDSGVGIRSEYMDKLYEPYFTTKEAGKGTGLGLAVVYGIIKDHGGDIRIRSEVNKGSTVDVFFPLIGDVASTPSDLPEDYQARGSERILLVDDELPVAKLGHKMLERLGYQVISFTSSAEALDAFQKDPQAFDLVITDMNMPGITGDQLAETLIALRPDIPIIMCTGFSERISPETAKEIGIKGFLMKPVIKSSLSQEVRRLLDQATRVS